MRNKLSFDLQLSARKAAIAERIAAHKIARSKVSVFLMAMSAGVFQYAALCTSRARNSQPLHPTAYHDCRQKIKPHLQIRPAARRVKVLSNPLWRTPPIHPH